MGSYIQEELDAREWSIADLAARMGDTKKEREIWELTIELHIVLGDEPGALLGQTTANALARAFGTSPQYWMNLDAHHQQWMKEKNIVSAPSREQ